MYLHAVCICTIYLSGWLAGSFQKKLRLMETSSSGQLDGKAWYLITAHLDEVGDEVGAGLGGAGLGGAVDGAVAVAVAGLEPVAGACLLSLSHLLYLLAITLDSWPICMMIKYLIGSYTCTNLCISIASSRSD